MSQADVIPIVLFCPHCHKQHIDEGVWATKPHRTHQCVDDAMGKGCQKGWTPSAHRTVGVHYRDLRFDPLDFTTNDIHAAERVLEANSVRVCECLLKGGKTCTCGLVQYVEPGWRTLPGGKFEVKDARSQEECTCISCPGALCPKCHAGGR